MLFYMFLHRNLDSSRPSSITIPYQTTWIPLKLYFWTRNKQFH